MTQSEVVGIDIGTNHVKVVIADPAKSGDKGPKIKGHGFSESKGLRHGYIINTSDAIESIREAIREAEKDAKTTVKEAFVSVGGIGLSGVITKASVVVSRADSQITQIDIQNVQNACSQEIPTSESQNRQIIHDIPIQYRIDGQPVLGDPLKMKGARLEAKMLFINCLEQHVNDIITAVEEAGVRALDVMASPLAAAMVTLTKTQRIAGCVLANIGAETVSMVVYENNIPISLEVFPIGSTDITNDIALGLKVPLDEAQKIKEGSKSDESYSKRKLDEIVRARLSDMFDLINKHLEEIGRSGLLPAGIVITGGGSGIGEIDDLARSLLNLPATLGKTKISRNNSQVSDSTWAVAYGLCVWGIINGSRKPLVFSGIFKKIVNSVVSWIKKILP